MSLKELKLAFDKPISQWPVFFKDGLPFIYNDDYLFYDEEGNLLGQHVRHNNLAVYLRLLLEWYYFGQTCPVTSELSYRAAVTLAQSLIVSGKLVRRGYVEITPDVAVLKGVPAPDTATYRIGPGKPPPSVVFEIGSPSTYNEDLVRKFLLYEQVIKAQEYIVYDPLRNRLWEGSRLKGWRLVDGRYEEMPTNERGWRWSEEMQSWLVEDGEILRLYDAQGNLRLTKSEYNAAQRDAEKVRADTEKARADEATARADAERVKAAEEKARADELAARLQLLEAQLTKLNPPTEQ